MRVAFISTLSEDLNVESSPIAAIDRNNDVEDHHRDPETRPTRHHESARVK